MRPAFPAVKPVFFSPVVTFSLPPDMVPWLEWEAALRGLNWLNIGSRPSRYPSDVRALLRWAAPLRRWVGAHEHPIRARLKPETLQTLAEAMHRTIKFNDNLREGCRTDG
jgi:hypothetical protein